MPLKEEKEENHDGCEIPNAKEDGLLICLLYYGGHISLGGHKAEGTVHPDKAFVNVNHAAMVL